MSNVGRRTSLRVVALVAVFALFASACSDDDTTQPTTSTQEGASATVNRDGTLRWGYGLTQQGNFSLDPTIGSSGGSMDPLLYLIYGRLMRKMPDGTLTPDLAESAEVVDDNTTTVKIRPDLTWTDGTGFDANSVKTGLERNLNSNNTSNFNAGFFAGTPTLTVVDPLSLRIAFTGGNAASWYDSFIAGIQTTIVKPDLDVTRPIGAGPMKIASYSPGQSMVLERNEDFWNADAVNFARIEIVSVEQQESSSALNALQAGQADVATLQVDQLPALSGDLEEIAVSDPNRMLRFVTCKRDAPLDNVDLRKAISQGMDRQAISDALFGGTAEVATQFWPEGNRFYNTDVGDELGYDPESARQLVQQSGVANPEFDVYLIGSFGIPAVAEVVKEQLAAVGITINLKLTNNFVTEFLEPKLPGATFIPQTPGPGALRLQTVVGTGLGNLCGYRNPELEQLATDLSKVSQDSDEAKDIWWSIEEILAEEVPMNPVLFVSLTGGYDSSKLVFEDAYPDGPWILPDIYTSYMAS
jgi:peptide/nickel transport system substrate-binding protein